MIKRNYDKPNSNLPGIHGGSFEHNDICYRFSLIILDPVTAIAVGGNHTVGKHHTLKIRKSIGGDYIKTFESFDVWGDCEKWLSEGN